MPGRRIGGSTDVSSAAGRYEAEMFHGVGKIHRVAAESRVLQRLIQNVAGRPDEGHALPIFLIAWLFAYQHYPRHTRTLSKYRLRSRYMELAPLARTRCVRHSGQISLLWNKESGAGPVLLCANHDRHASLRLSE